MAISPAEFAALMEQSAAEDEAQGFGPQFGAGLSETLQSIPAFFTGEQVQRAPTSPTFAGQAGRFLGQAAPEVAVGAGVEALTAGLGIPLGLAARGALGGAAAGLTGGLREGTPVTSAAMGVGGALGASALGKVLSKLFGSKAAQQLVQRDAASTLDEIASAANPYIAAKAVPSINPMDDLMRRAAEGDPYAFGPAAQSLGMGEAEIAGVLAKAPQGTKQGQYFADALARKAKESADAALLPPPVASSPPMPEELAQQGAASLKALKESIETGKPLPPSLTPEDAVRTLAKEKLRRELIASAKAELGDEAAEKAEKGLTRVFQDVDDETLHYIDESIEMITNPKAMSAFADKLSNICVIK